MGKPRFTSRPTLFRAAIELGADGKAPTEFPILQAGANPTDRGYDLMFDDIAAAMVMQAYQVDGRARLYADWNHGMLPDEDGDGPDREEGASACSFIPEVRDGALWATGIEWTADGRSDVESRRYNLFSPACEQWTDDMGVTRPRRLINFALVNLAGLRGIQPLLAAMAEVNVTTRTKESDMSPEEIKRLQDRNAELEAALAKLRPIEGEVVALGGILSLSGSVGAAERAEAVRNVVSLKTDVLALTGETTVAGARGVLEAWKAKASGYDKLAREKEEGEIAAFSAKIDEVIAQGAKDMKAGFEPAAHAEIKAVAIKLGGGKASKDGVDYVVALAARMPKIAGAAGTEARPPAGGGLSDADKALIKRHGLKVEVAEVEKARLDGAR